ncbi:Crp/Fnr family transcriptional regulator [Shewanella submarina]|uniref:Crp/Fnr family transcriptional regulator n=1 Tax=Shewanella submarina TaxID=2016376 RepID=A0ABV7GIS4_9GAMM|nr:Crp/Fnr family transcriptional regulator [Shewanella submarina]MCL1035851.1 Crp/Fnr family transcriptional regulator [Shewanella submarina]
MQLAPYAKGRFAGHLDQQQNAFREALLNCDHQLLNMEQGQHLLTQGEAQDALYLVPEGKVSMHISAINGRRFQLGEVNCHWHLYGEMEFFTGTVCQWSVVAEARMQIRQICLKSVQQLLLKQPEFSLFFASALAWDYQDSLDIYTNRLLHTISYNIAWDLLHRPQTQANLHGFGKMDQEAERFGTTSRVFRRAVRELIDKGLVEKQGASLKILDFDRLKQFVDQG